jgi:hypothetical protein
MASYGMLRRVDLVGTDVFEELSASFIWVTRIGDLGTLAVTNNRRTLRRNTNIWCPRLDSRRYQIFSVVVVLERVPLSLVRIIKELIEFSPTTGGRTVGIFR